MGVGSPRLLRVLIGGAVIALVFAPAAWADVGPPVSATAPDVSAAAELTSSAATVSADGSASTATVPTASVAAGVSTPAAAVGAQAGAPAASEPAAAQTKAAIGGEPAATARATAGSTPTAEVALPTIRVGDPTHGSARPAALKVEGRVAAATGVISRRSNRPAAKRARPAFSPSTHLHLSASPQVADTSPAGGPLFAARGPLAPVPDVADRASRKRASASAPAPSPGVPQPLGPSGSAAASGAQSVASLLLLAALAAALAVLPPGLRHRRRIARIPIRSSPYRLLLERPG